MIYRFNAIFITTVVFSASIEKLTLKLYRDAMDPAQFKNS